MANIEEKLFDLKQFYEAQSFELKLQKEKELINILEKKDFHFFSNLTKNSQTISLVEKVNFESQECVEWVYRGSATREEAANACRGVNNMSCVEWVYRGSATRTEAAEACRRVESMECAEWVYRGSANREESAAACRGVRDMQCVEWVYRGSATREEAARACSNGRNRPDRPRCD